MLSFLSLLLLLLLLLFGSYGDVGPPNQQNGNICTSTQGERSGTTIRLHITHTQLRPHIHTSATTAAVQRQAEGEVEERDPEDGEDEVVDLRGEGLEEREQRRGQQEPAGLLCVCLCSCV